MKISSRYLNEIVHAYVSYLKEKGLYEALKDQELASWAVPLTQIIKRIKDRNFRNLPFEKHVKLCEKLSWAVSGFEYLHNPLKVGEEDEHLIMIKMSLVWKIVGR